MRLREVQATTQFTIAEGAIALTIQIRVPAPTATDTEVTARDEHGRIRAKRDTHHYEEDT